VTDDMLITTAQAAALHDVAPATIRDWRRRGILTPVATVAGRHLYRLRDVDEAEYVTRTRDTTGRARQRVA